MTQLNEKKTKKTIQHCRYVHCPERDCPNRKRGHHCEPLIPLAEWVKEIEEGLLIYA